MPFLRRFGCGSFGTTHAIHPENPVFPAFGHTREWRFRRVGTAHLDGAKPMVGDAHPTEAHGERIAKKGAIHQLPSSEGAAFFLALKGRQYHSPG